MAKPSSAKGFTLIELLIVVVILGVTLVMLNRYTAMFATANRSYAQEREKSANQKIVAALMDYSRNLPPTGTDIPGAVPTPYTEGTAGGVNSAPGYLLGTATALTPYLQQTGLSPLEIHSDGRAAERMRVMQLVSGLQVDVPFFLTTGPLAAVDYQVGVLYTTDCERTNTACNPGGTTIPTSSTASPVLTSTNANTWKPSAEEFGVTMFSTLTLQKQMLSLTSNRLETIRNDLIATYRNQQLAAAADATDNFYPRADGTSGVNAGSFTPSTNHGCYDGWIDLTSSGNSVLEVIGLDQGENSRTAWGGRVDYCRDYLPPSEWSNPSKKAANARPNYGALRLNRFVSQRLNPSSVYADNLYLPF